MNDQSESPSPKPATDAEPSRPSVPDVQPEIPADDDISPIHPFPALPDDALSGREVTVQAFPAAVTGREATLTDTAAQPLIGNEPTMPSMPAALTGNEPTMPSLPASVTGREATVLTDTAAGAALTGREATMPAAAVLPQQVTGRERTLVDDVKPTTPGAPTTPATVGGKATTPSGKPATAGGKPPTLGGKPITGSGTSAGFDDAWHLQGRRGPFTGQTWGDFDLGGILGEGGMGAVYRAKQRSLYRRVALKVLPPNLAADHRLLERFMLEARIASVLQSPHVVQVYAIGEHEGNHYFAMEFVEGTDLYEVMKARREAGNPIGVDEAADYVLQAARGLGEAGRHGIVHRDIKPPNLMVTRKDNLVKIADFGIVKVLGEHQLTMTGQAVGTPAYCSPEQGRGDRTIDQRSDLYALGVVFYELLCGKKPFEGTTPSALIYQHCYDEPELPQKVNPKITPEYQAVVLRLLQKKPENRYQSADELVTDLQAIKTGAMLKSALANFKGTGADEARREQMNWFQRHLLPIALAAGVAVLGGGAGLYWYMDVRSQEQRVRSERIAALSDMDKPASLPQNAARSIDDLATVLGNSDERIVRWRAKLGRIETLQAKLAPLDQGVTAPLRVSAPPDLDALAAEIGTADPAVVRWRGLLDDAARRDEALRQKLGVLDTQALTQATRDQLAPSLEQLRVLAPSTDRQVTAWSARLDAFDKRVAALVGQLVFLDGKQAITETKRAAAVQALGEVRPLLGESDARVQRWNARLAAAGSTVDRLRRSLGEALGRSELPSLAVRDRSDVDLVQFKALVETDDPDLKRWQAQITAADAAMTRCRERLADLDTLAAEGLLPVARQQPLRDDLAALAALARPGDADVLRWGTRLQQQAELVAALRERLARLDATHSDPITVAAQRSLAVDLARLNAAGGLDEAQARAAQARLDAEAARVTALRERLAVCDRAVSFHAELRADLDRLAQDVGTADPDVARWSGKRQRVDDLLAKLAALGDEAQPVPADCRTLYPRLIGEVGPDDPAVVRWRGRMQQVAELDAALVVFDRVTPLPTDADNLIRRSAALFGVQDGAHVRRAAKVARVGTLKQQLGRLNETVAESATALAADRAALAELAALVSVNDRDVPATARRLDELMGPVKPAWATVDGRDAYGRWADATVRGQTVRFRWCPPGRARLGSAADEKGRDADEVPATILITQGFWLADSECPQALWTAATGANPSRHIGGQFPVERVSLTDVEAALLRFAPHFAGVAPRLPSEAEWEYACRAGNTGSWPEGTDATPFAWCAANADHASHKIRQRFPNALGLFDLHGNVWEWCAGRLAPYPTAATADWIGRDGEDGVVRGGSWGDAPAATRSANRQAARIDLRSAYVGFRLAFDAQWTTKPDGIALLADLTRPRRRIEMDLGAGKWVMEVDDTAVPLAQPMTGQEAVR
jgi:formylglycine-generating enzyme required for sulfatase activity/tRNA A-37 threonylcarbamoyl transferase component Bud32